MRSLLSFLKSKVLFTALLVLHTFQPSHVWTAGGYNGFHNNFRATYLEVKSYGAQSLTDLSFVTRVGGVAFDAVARPALQTDFSSLELLYDSRQTDGQRLKIILDNRSYTASLPDWQLIPIALFADSYHTSCVTLFGEESTLLDHHIKFHPAFQNRLLGMRLLQADMMFENPYEFSEVFKYNGRHVLGRGEVMPDADKVSAALDEVSSTLERFGDRSYDSYVVTDAGVSIQFSVSNNSFSLTGSPYYYFFKYGDNGEVLPSTALTQAMKQRATHVRNMNPLVFDASRRTMRYAAFFRYVKQEYPAEWQQFLSSVRNIRPLPAVTTPTGMSKY